jgi:hypothetical protein
MYKKIEHIQISKYMDKKLSHFQVYGYSDIIVNLVPNHQFIVDTWCEQYIEYITNISHLRNKWLHMKTQHLVYI